MPSATKLPRGLSVCATVNSSASGQPQVLSLRGLLSAQHPAHRPRRGHKLKTAWVRSMRDKVRRASQTPAEHFRTMAMVRESRLAATVRDMEGRLLRQGILAAPSSILRSAGSSYPGLARESFYDADDVLINDEGDLATLNTIDGTGYAAASAPGSADTTESPTGSPVQEVHPCDFLAVSELVSSPSSPAEVECSFEQEPSADRNRRPLSITTALCSIRQSPHRSPHRAPPTDCGTHTAAMKPKATQRHFRLCRKQPPPPCRQSAHGANEELDTKQPAKSPEERPLTPLMRFLAVGRSRAQQ
eukprot:gnl/TRDRNA2_/TRDRNA2_77688_c0_seq1.p1 gnl/TRDRNA2_/TRDRNA2_77688_c0~~gnl/TRDRNA2_/TRDRNA2_77688_c0_seq1.p1  ORF type:complete len:309 (-),score=44.84 gnl/TRDRNA2_/TRDRNA2_77688_c0_seq1:81-986(-)